MELNQLMEADHSKINTLFDTFFISYEKDINHILDLLEKLKWEIERHILIEEKEVFTTFLTNYQEDQLMVNRLLDEHRKILAYLDLVKNGLVNGKKIKIDNFQKLWLEHEQFERETFYPELNRKLNQEQKLEITQKVNTLIYTKSN